MVQSQLFNSFRLYMYFTPQNYKVGDYLGAAFPQPETRRGRCFACELYYRHEFSQKPPPSLRLLPTLHKHATTSHSWLCFFALSSGLKARSPFAEAQKEGKCAQRCRDAQGSSYLSPGDGWMPEGCRSLGKMQLSVGSSTRPGLCSWAAPVRFSNSRTAAKSLPMPEEFPEQHSPSFSNCFETTLSVLQ